MREPVAGAVITGMTEPEVLPTGVTKVVLPAVLTVYMPVGVITVSAWAPVTNMAITNTILRMILSNFHGRTYYHVHSIANDSIAVNHEKWTVVFVQQPIFV